MIDVVLTDYLARPNWVTQFDDFPICVKNIQTECLVREHVQNKLKSTENRNLISLINAIRLFLVVAYINIIG